MTRIMSEDQLDFFRKNEYVHVRGVIPEELLELAASIVGRWVEELADGWVEAGLLRDKRPELDFGHRLVKLWNEAGRPKYSRSPRRDLVGPEMFAYLKHPVLVDLASDVLGTEEISVHGVFNARPKLPDQSWTDTPWHQDAQYYRDAEHVPVISMWMPLQRTTERNSCLQVAPGVYRDSLREGVVDDYSHFLGLGREDSESLQGISVEMERGDVLIFNQLLPHRALPNRSDAVRWSMDIRYEATPTATESGKQFGFVARSPQDPSAEESCERWLAKWKDVPKGHY